MTRSSVAVRKIEKNDYAAVHDLVSQIMQAEFPSDTAVFPTEDLGNIAASYGALGEAFFVAVDGKKMVGTIGVKREDERTALLRRFFVAPSHRRQKVGTQLVDKAVSFCREVGYQKIEIRTTTQMASAIELCRKLGFSERERVALAPKHELVKFSLFLKENSPLVR